MKKHKKAGAAKKLTKNKVTALASSNKDRWDKFCFEYVKDFDRTGAVEKAGFKCKTHNSRKRVALRLLSTNVYCQEKIYNLLKAQEKRAEKTADQIIREMEKLAFSNIEDYLSFGAKGIVLNESSKLTREQLAAISEVSDTHTKHGQLKRTFKLYDKKGALVELGKRFRCFPNTQTVDIGAAQSLADIVAIMMGKDGSKD